MDGLLRDLMLAARRLAATPLFTVFAVASLAVGVGVTTVAYAVVDSFFFSSPGMPQPERLGLVMTSGTGRYRFEGVISRADYEDLRRGLPALGPFAASERFFAGVAGPSTTERVAAEAVTPDYFQVMGVPAAHGRVILPGDDAAAPVAVLAHTFWRRRFNSDASVVGQTIRVDGRAFEIVGVTPASFTGIGLGEKLFGTGLFVPIDSVTPVNARVGLLPPPGTLPRPETERLLSVAVRLGPGQSVQAAAAQVSTFSEALDLSRPLARPEDGPPRAARRVWTVRTAADGHADRGNQEGRLGIVLTGLVGLVLLVACTNLANLVLARGTARRQEVAIRRALGAGRWRLVRELMAESAVLAAAGAASAFLVMRGLLAAMPAELAVGPFAVIPIQPELDASLMAFACVAVLVSLVVFGLEPAIQLTRRTDVRAALASGAGGVGVPGRRRQRTLLRWQVATSAGFFILASMTVRFVFVELGHDPGVDIDRIAIASVEFTGPTWDEARARRTLDRLLEIAGRDRAVDGFAISSGLPFGTYQNPRARLSMPDRPIVRGAPGPPLVMATPSIFSVAGIRLLRGRAFDDRDTAGAPTVILLSESAARGVFGSSDAVGRELRVQVMSGPAKPPVTATVIGITAETDTHYLDARRSGTVYAPLAQHYHPYLTVVARTVRTPEAAVGAIRSWIRQADPDLAIVHAGTGRTMLTGPYAFLRSVSTASLSLGVLTLTLAMVGLFGVQMSGVLHRTREIGVRLSFGASPRQIQRLILRDGYRPVIEGLAIGVLIGTGGRAVIRAYLDARIGILDPWMLLVVPVPIVFAALCACYLPASRASRVDPVVALRAD